MAKWRRRVVTFIVRQRISGGGNGGMAWRGAMHACVSYLLYSTAANAFTGTPLPCASCRRWHGLTLPSCLYPLATVNVAKRNGMASWHQHGMEAAAAARSGNKQRSIIISRFSRI